MPDVSEFASASGAAAMEVLVLFADDLPPLADGPRWAQRALRIAADYPGPHPALLPAVWLPPAATVTPLREDAHVV
jgi:hypothetical protein